MAFPIVDPPVLTIRAAPGELRSGVIKITDMTEEAGITVSVQPDDGPLVIESVVVEETIMRPASEDEIKELPAYPPSIRENARRDGLPLTVEAGRSDGVIPLPVSEGATLLITFSLTVGRVSNASGATMGARVTVNRTSGPPIEVPALVLIGTSNAIASFSPPSLTVPVDPGEVLEKLVEIRQAPAGSTVVALLGNNDPIIRINRVVVFGGVRRDFTEEELAQMEEWVREDARRTGYIEYTERSRAAAGEPLRVSVGDMVQAFIQVSAPVSSSFARVDNRLILESTGWQRIVVPIEVSIGLLSIELPTSSITIDQGATAALDVILSSRGPETEVRFELGTENDAFRVNPSLIRLREREIVRKTLDVTVDPTAPLGHYNTQLVARFFNFSQRVLPIDLTLVPGSVRVIVLDRALVALQGERAFCRVQVVVSGGYKRLHFDAGVMPPGVRMLSRDDWMTNGEASVILQLEFAIDRDSRPADDLPLSVTWTANDGFHTGSFTVRLRVLLNPESRSFSQAILTPAGTPLGGRVDMTLNNDGTGSFRGHMRATGAFSYNFRVRSVVRSADGAIAVMAQKSGSVGGSFDPFEDQEFSWNDPVLSPVARDQWPGIRNGSMVVSKSYELEGFFGGLADLVRDVALFIGAAALLNPVVAGGARLVGLIMVGSELAELSGVHVIGPGGLVGLVVAGGASFLFGGGVFVPVFVGGAVASELLVKHRSLAEPEMAPARDFAKRVFGDTLPFDRVILTNLSGENGQEFVTPSVDGSILMNLGDGFDNPTTHVDPRRGFIVEGQIFIHELTHVWQIAHAGIIADYFWRAALDKVGGSASYNYGPPGPVFSSFGLEAQASLVEEWFSGTDFDATMPIPGRSKTNPIGMQDNDPYIGYINNNIRLAEA